LWERGPDIGQRHILGHSDLGFARHVAQNVHSAAFAVHGGEYPVDMVGVGDVAGDRQRLAAKPADGVRGCLDASRVAVEQYEVGADLGQCERHDAAHALCAAGHDGGPAGQIKQVGHG
jgi:hypothetical protein